MCVDIGSTTGTWANYQSCFPKETESPFLVATNDQQQGCGFLSYSPVHARILVGLMLCRSCSCYTDNELAYSMALSSLETVFVTAVSYKPWILQTFLPLFWWPLCTWKWGTILPSHLRLSSSMSLFFFLSENRLETTYHHEAVSLDEVSLNMSHGRKQDWPKLVLGAVFYGLESFSYHNRIFVLSTYILTLYTFSLFFFLTYYTAKTIMGTSVKSLIFLPYFIILSNFTSGYQLWSGQKAKDWISHRRLQEIVIVEKHREWYQSHTGDLNVNGKWL